MKIIKLIFLLLVMVLSVYLVVSYIQDSRSDNMPCLTGGIFLFLAIIIYLFFSWLFKKREEKRKDKEEIKPDFSPKLTG